MKEIQHLLMGLGKEVSLADVQKYIEREKQESKLEAQVGPAPYTLLTYTLHPGPQTPDPVDPRPWTLWTLDSGPRPWTLTLRYEAESTYSEREKAESKLEARTYARP
eukprot:2827269-Rhodomonas_salina.1